jgi:hypothetical protein
LASQENFKAFLPALERNEMKVKIENNGREVPIRKKGLEPF